MLQSRVEIKQNSASVKNELTVLIKDWSSPQNVWVPVLFIASTSSYTHKGSLTLGCYIEYTPGTVDMW